jgi:type IV pilus assembly protein PilC
MSDAIDIRKIKKQLSEHSGDKLVESGKGKSFLDFINTDIRLGRKILTDKIKESFYLELWSLLSAGVDIRTALDLIRQEQKKKRVLEVLENVQRLTIAGASFSSSLKESKEFSTYEYFSVRIGEETGKLLKILKDLSDYFGKRIKQRRQIIGAITYPVVVLVVAFAAVSFMVSFVVPMFSDTFKRFGSDLPGITKTVIAISLFVKKSLGFFFLWIIGMIILCIWCSKKEWFRKLSSKLLLATPVIGKIIHKIYLGRFANTMSLLIAAKIPLVNAIQLVRQMVTFYPIEDSLIDVEKKIIEGHALHAGLAKHKIYPAKMVSIIKVGEEVNQLDLFFSRLSEQYTADVEHQTGMLSKFLEPVIIIILGLIVGVILIAMYLPMFKLGQAF